jgi:GGDEF domain-containing protein
MFLSQARAMNFLRLLLALVACLVFHSTCIALEKFNSESATALSELDKKDTNLPIVSLGNWPVAISAAQVVQASNETQSVFDTSATHYASWDTPLWLRLRIKADTPTPAGSWVLSFNKPLIEQIEVYTKSPEGFWQKQTAGIFTKHRNWPQRSLAPQFLMPSWTAGEHDVLVRVLHHFPVHFSVKLLTSEATASSNQNQFLLAGLLLGLMGLMCCASIIMAFIYHHASYVWYALYVGISFFACASYIGMANYWLWPDSPWWATNSSAALTMASMMAQTQFGRSIFMAKHTLLTWRRYAVDAILLICAVLTIFSVYTDSATVGALLLVLVVTVLAVTMLVFVMQALKQNNRTAKLWCLAYLPLIILLALTIIDNLGWMALDWLTYYAPVYALIFEMPVLLVALHLYAKTQHSQLVQQTTLARTDPTTGFVISEQFFATLESLWDAAENTGQDMAIAYVEVTFHLDYIAMRGKPPNDRTQNRVVRMLRTVARDHETVVHIGQNLYAILMPNTTLGEALSIRLSRLIAIGSMTDTEMDKDVPIRFHIAATTLHSFASSIKQLDEALRAKLNDANGWQNKAIRFVRKRPEYSIRSTTL